MVAMEVVFLAALAVPATRQLASATTVQAGQQPHLPIVAGHMPDYADLLDNKEDEGDVLLDVDLDADLEEGGVQTVRALKAGWRSVPPPRPSPPPSPLSPPPPSRHLAMMQITCAWYPPSG